MLLIVVPSVFRSVVTLSGHWPHWLKMSLIKFEFVKFTVSLILIQSYNQNFDYVIFYYSISHLWGEGLTHQHDMGHIYSLGYSFYLLKCIIKDRQTASKISSTMEVVSSFDEVEETDSESSVDFCCSCDWRQKL